MKKALTILLTLALVAVFAFALVACNDKGNNNGGNNGGNATPTEYTITFDSKGGSEVAPIKAEAGAQIQAPANPTKNGFEFLGWFESSDSGNTLAENAFVIAYMPAKNVTLYAKWAAVTEVGNKYAVKKYQTDVTFKFDDPAKTPEDLEEYQMMYSTMWVLFKENHAVEIYLNAELDKDDTRFYGINAKNGVEFFETVEDAENMTNKLTSDYYGWSYTLDSSRKTLTISARNEEVKMTLTMVLSVVK